jgi:protein-tyrosine phosphatase
MIDLHLHILPGVDDGAATPHEALAMAAALLAAGVHTVAATPHFDDWTHDVLPDRGAIERHVAALNDLLGERGLGLTVLPGGECFLSPNLPELVGRGVAPVYGPGRYLLLELPHDLRAGHADRVVAEVHRHGTIVLLAHAERYAFVQRDLYNLGPLLTLGIGVQVSLGSLSPRAPSALRRTAEALLAQGIAHVLATDAHQEAGVRGALDMLHRARGLVGADNLAVLTEENPRRILAGEQLLACRAVGMHPASAPGRRWWPFRR